MPKPTPQPKPVTCATCSHFVRDTSGPSYNIYSHVYFMGTSDIGCDPDNTYNKKTNKAEIFADKPRLGPNHKPLPKQ